MLIFSDFIPFLCLPQITTLTGYKGLGMILAVFGPHLNLLKIAWFLLLII